MNDPDLFDALAMNRLGRLAPHQVDALGRRARRSRIRRAIKAVAAIVMAPLILYLSARLAALGLGEAFSPLAASGLAGLLIVIVVFVLRPWSDPLGDDVRDGCMESVTGVPSPAGRERASDVWRWAPVAILEAILKVSSTSTPDRIVVVGGRRLDFSTVDREATLEGDLRAYYLPRSMTVVSLERAPTQGHTDEARRVP